MSTPHLRLYLLRLYCCDYGGSSGKTRFVEEPVPKRQAVAPLLTQYQRVMFCDGRSLGSSRGLHGERAWFCVEECRPGVCTELSLFTPGCAVDQTKALWEPFPRVELGIPQYIVYQETFFIRIRGGVSGYVFTVSLPRIVVKQTSCTARRLTS